MTAALYATIWIALALFVAGEAGKRQLLHRETAPAWGWRAWTLGALLCALHILIAFADRYHWSHEAAVRETARQTAAVYGVSWGGGVYVNYLFVSIWLLEAWWWRMWPVHYVNRPYAVTWGLRVFYFVIIGNAAIVFASGSGRILGIALAAVLLLTWRREAVEAESSPRDRGRIT